MKTQIIIALKFILVMTLLTGVAYPLAMTGIAHLTFPKKANGSLIMKDGKLIGSELIGQKFDSSIYFSSRPSAVEYNPIPSAASNLGPTSDKLKNLVEERRINFSSINMIEDTASIPKEMIFASGSGLDPHISPEAAFMQVDRIVIVRRLSDPQKHQLINLIKSEIENAQFGLFGERRINVLSLNLKTNALFLN